MSDTEYMKLAIKLAKKGAGYVNPNPMVGAVIVKDNRIIGQGYHEIFGGLISSILKKNIGNTNLKFIKSIYRLRNI